MLKKCHYYAELVSVLCSVIMNIRIIKDHRKQVYLDYKCKWKQSGEAADDNVVELELLEAMFLLICNQAWSNNVLPGPVSCLGIPWFWQSFNKAQRIEETLHYYSSIVLNSFTSKFCSKFQNYAGIMWTTLFVFAKWTDLSTRMTAFPIS